MIPVNDLGNWTVGQLSPNWEFPLQRADTNGNVSSRVMDLTGVTTNQLSLIIYNAAKAKVGTGTGTFTINNVKPGVVTYAQSSSDMATAGVFYYRVEINYNGTSPDYSDYIHISIAN